MGGSVGSWHWALRIRRSLTFSLCLLLFLKSRVVSKLTRIFRWWSDQNKSFACFIMNFYFFFLRFVSGWRVVGNGLGVAMMLLGCSGWSSLCHTKLNSFSEKNYKKLIDVILLEWCATEIISLVSEHIIIRFSLFQCFCARLDLRK